MKSQAKLRVVKDAPEDIDITALLHAEIPGEDHWRGVHVSGDRREAVDLPTMRKGWRR